jgi:hypothetical protein
VIDRGDNLIDRGDNVIDGGDNVIGGGDNVIDDQDVTRRVECRHRKATVWVTT